MSKDAYLDKMVSTFVGIIINYFSQVLAEVATSTTNAISTIKAGDKRAKPNVGKAMNAFKNLLDLDIKKLMEELQQELEDIMEQVAVDSKVVSIAKYMDKLQRRLQDHGFDVEVTAGPETGFMYGILDALFLGNFNEKKLRDAAEAQPTKAGTPRPMPAVIMDELLAEILPTPEAPAEQEDSTSVEDFLEGLGVKLK